jgi:iron complex transport system permease protein
MSKRNKFLLIILPFVLLLASILIGRYFIPPLQVFQVLLAKVLPIDHDWPAKVATVVFEVRLPRALLAFLIGASLSLAGSAFQGVFRNPLVSPDILGVSSGAGFGAALAILLSWSPGLIQISALAFGILAVALAYLLSRIYHADSVIMLVLSGVVVSAFFGALISLTKTVADPLTKLPAITFWLMGSLSASTTKDLVMIAPTVILGAVGLLLVRWRLNVLSMGDEEARSMGLNTRPMIGFIIICATLITAASVSVSGIIGWVGLMVPHLGRMLVGPDHRYLMPASVAIGGSYLMLMDNIARTASTAEIPLGILTAIIGAPFFAFLLRKTRGGWL